MGVKESRELSRRIIYREILDHEGVKIRNATPWERIAFCLRHSVAPDHYNHEKWAAFLATPPWVHYLRAEFLDDWLYFPVKASHALPASIGKRVGEWYGKCRLALEQMESDHSFAKRIVEAALEPIEDGHLLEEGFADEIIRSSGLILRHRTSLVGRCARLASLGSFEDAAAYFSGFATGLKAARKILDARRFELDREREFIATMLCDEWEHVVTMSSRTNLRDYVASRLPARMRRAVNTSEAGRLAFHERMLALCKQAGIKLASRGKPGKNGKAPD